MVRRRHFAAALAGWRVGKSVIFGAAALGGATLALSAKFRRTFGLTAVDLADVR